MPSESLAKRIIACLDVNAGRVAKGIQFVQLQDAGDPAELAMAHSHAGADEVVLLDITATAESRNTLLETVRCTSRDGVIRNRFWHCYVLQTVVSKTDSGRRRNRQREKPQSSCIWCSVIVNYITRLLT